EVQRQRHACDAVWTGIGTVLADDPLLTDRTRLPRRRPLLRVISDSKLRLPLNARLLQQETPDVLVFCNAEADSEKRLALQGRGVRVCVLPGHPRHSPQAVVEELGRREITSVFLEAGAELNGAVLEAGVVDKVFLYYAPKLLHGGDALPMAGGAGLRSLKD